MKNHRQLLMELELKDHIVEMANIDSRTHGFGVDVKLHLMQPGNSLRHGPRVKVFKKTLQDSFSIILSKKESEIILDPNTDYKPLLNKTQYLQVLDGVKRHRIAFLKFWNTPTMTVDELKDLMNKN